MRLALFTIESAAADAAARTLIERRPAHMAAVFLSQRSPLGEGWRHLRRSGAEFTSYLAANFVVAPALARLSGRPHLRKTCRRLGIPVVPVRDVNAGALRQRLRDDGVDLIVSLYFDRIFDAETVASVSRGAVNVHPAPLPSYRGPCPLIHMAVDGVADGAVSVHRIADRTIDAGPVLASRPVAFHAAPTILARERRCFAAGVDLLCELLDHMDTALAAAQPQGPGSYQGFPDRATLARLRRRGVPLYTRADTGPA